jgi:hypothetical protein
LRRRTESKNYTNSLPFMAPSSSSGGRKRKRGRRDWDEGGSVSGARSVREPMRQEGHSQRGEAQGSGTRLILSLI